MELNESILAIAKVCGVVCAGYCLIGLFCPFGRPLSGRFGLRRLLEFSGLRRLPVPTLCVLAGLLVASVLFAQKPSGGGTNGVDVTEGATNGVDVVAGDTTNGVDWIVGGETNDVEGIEGNANEMVSCGGAGRAAPPCRRLPSTGSRSLLRA